MHAHILLAVATALAPPTPCDELLGALNTLAHGSMEARWQLLDDEIPYIEELLDDERTDVASCADRARTVLLSTLRQEKDDRIVVRLLDDISWDDCDQLGGYLLEALSDRSPNIRRRAAIIISETDCEHHPAQLRTMWEDEPRPWIRSAAAYALASVGDTTELEDFHRLALDDGSYLGEAAAEAIIELNDPRSVSILLLLTKSQIQNRADLAERALAAMRQKAAPEPFVPPPVLEGVDEEDPLTGQFLNFLDDAVAKSEDASPPRVELRTHEIPLRSDAAAAEVDFGRMVAHPADGELTQRCWDAPGYAYPADDHARIPAGAEFHATDVFEWKGELWYYVEGFSISCWAPASALAAEPGEVPHEPGVWEFDMPRADLDSSAARRAEHAGFATRLDETDDVIGVKLAPATGDRDQILWVLDTWDAADEALAKGISDWLRVNAASWVGDADLEARIAALRDASN